MENGERAEIGRMDVDGALPLNIAVEKMASMGLITRRAHSEEDPHTHKVVLNRCHEIIHPATGSTEHGLETIQFTERGRQRAEDVIRRHRLAERLFMQTLRISNEAVVEQQACKFEHILSPEATDSICTFLNHPETCPHGSPIPRGACCAEGAVARPEAMLTAKK